MHGQDMQQLNRRQMLSLACVCAAGLAGLMWPQAAVSALATTVSRGSTETEALTAAQLEYNKAREELASIGQKLEQTQYELKATEEQLTQLAYDIAQTSKNITVKTGELDTAQAALSSYLEIAYKSGTTNILDLILSSADFNDMVTRSYYSTKIQDAQVETISEIRQIRDELQEQQQTLDRQQKEQQELSEQLTEQQKTLDSARQEAQQKVDSLSEEVKELFAQQQAELTVAAQVQAHAREAAEAATALGVNAPSVSQGSIVANAYACLGIPYVWGGDDENLAEVGGFDCSGFVQHCYRLQGYDIGRTTYDQIAQIKALGNWKESLDQLQAGDLVFPNEGHVGIYLGDKRMVDAPYPGTYIQIDPVDECLGGGLPIAASERASANAGSSASSSA